MMIYAMNKRLTPIITPMKKIFSLALLSSITLFQAYPVWASAQQTPDSQEHFLDGIAAVVNNKIILQSELQKRTQETVQKLEARNIAVPNLKALKLKVLNNIILEKLQKERIEQLGIEASDEEVLAQLQDIAKRNHITLLQLRDQLNLRVPNGFKILRKNIHQQLLLQKLKQIAVISKIQITEGEINNYLKRKSLQDNDTQYHIQQIMLTLPEGSTPEQRAEIKDKALKILQRLKEGEDFSQLAVRYSSGVKALEGGDLGWLTMNSIPTFFVSALQNLKVNQISPIIQSPIGFHIIKLIGKRQKGSKLVKQYNIYKFLVLSDKALTAQTPPKTLVSLAKNIHNLTDFYKLNKTFSQMPAKVNEHSHLGWVTPNKLKPKVAKAVVSLPSPHQAIAPIATQKGWEIVYLDGIRDQDLNQSNKRTAALQALRIQKANEAYEVWLRRLKENAIIENRLVDSKRTQE